MGIVPIKKESISEQVYKQLRDNLIDGTWKAGDKIPSENELANAFGISRVSVRQALSKLMTLGLIETRLGEGSFVKRIRPGVYMKDMIPLLYLSQESTEEVLEFRQIIEVETAGVAALKMTEKDILQLEEKFRLMQKYRDDLIRYTDEDLNFHKIIAYATDNSMVIQITDILQDVLRETIKNLTTKVGVSNGLYYHEQLIKAFKEKDADQVKKLMHKHLAELKEDYSS